MTKSPPDKISLKEEARRMLGEQQMKKVHLVDEKPWETA